jgi:hypothetical protein
MDEYHNSEKAGIFKYLPQGKGPLQKLAVIMWHFGKFKKFLNI